MAVDVIGAFYDLPADPETEEHVRLWGFHVNVTPDVLEAKPGLQSAVKTPAVYRRVWAGDNPESPADTVALRFNGENAAREALGDLWPVEPV